MRGAGRLETSSQDGWIELGRYRVILAAETDPPPSFQDIPSLLHSGKSVMLQGGRHQTYRVKVDIGTEAADLVFKQFGRQSRWKDYWDRIFGSKALRTYQVASFLSRHGIGTTKPFAIFEHWNKGRLLESYFVSRYLPDTLEFKDFLLEQLHGCGDARLVLDVLANVAGAIRKMHNAGCRHNDLGNQNIILAGAEGKSVQEREIVFLDLNRARFHRRLSIAARARDISRITLPPVLLGYFFKSYWGGVVPWRFSAVEKFFRITFALHTATRKIRHPWREIRYRRQADSQCPAHAVYPKQADIRLWDRNRNGIVKLRDLDIESLIGSDI